MSGKRKKRTALPAKTGAVWRQSADEATLAQNPRYNGFACGHGAHGDRKFNRAKASRAWKAQLRQEGASRGSFPVYVACRLGAQDICSSRASSIASESACKNASALSRFGPLRTSAASLRVNACPSTGTRTQPLGWLRFASS